MSPATATTLPNIAASEFWVRPQSEIEAQARLCIDEDDDSTTAG